MVSFLVPTANTCSLECLGCQRAAPVVGEISRLRIE
jgi:hypothetical protein